MHSTSNDRRSITPILHPKRRREYHARVSHGLCVKGCGAPVRNRSYCDACVDIQTIYTLRSLVRRFPEEARRVLDEG